MSAPDAASSSPKAAPATWKAIAFAVALVLFFGGGGALALFTRNSSADATLTPLVVAYSPVPPTTLIRTILPTTPTADAVVEVYVTGAVVAPGVYRLLPGERVSDAISAAGGFTDDADTDRVEMAQRVRDELHIVVPRKGQTVTAPQPTTATTPGARGGKNSTAIVNVNTATLADLETLPGIGPTLGQRLIDYRTQNGPFHSLDDLRKIHGFTQRVVNSVQNRVSF